MGVQRDKKKDMCQHTSLIGATTLITGHACTYVISAIGKHVLLQPHNTVPISSTIFLMHCPSHTLWISYALHCTISQPSVWHCKRRKKKKKKRKGRGSAHTGKITHTLTRQCNMCYAISHLLKLDACLAQTMLHKPYLKARLCSMASTAMPAPW